MSEPLGADEHPIRVGDAVRHHNLKRSDVKGFVVLIDRYGQVEIDSLPGIRWNAHNLIHTF